MWSSTKAAERWQYMARHWHILGERDRAALCQQIADYWRMALWRRLLHPEMAWAAYNQLSRMLDEEMAKEKKG